MLVELSWELSRLYSAGRPSRWASPHILVCVWSISGTAERISVKFTATTSFVARSDEFERQGQRSPETKTRCALRSPPGSDGMVHFAAWLIVTRSLCFSDSLLKGNIISTLQLTWVSFYISIHHTLWMSLVRVSDLLHGRPLVQPSTPSPRTYMRRCNGRQSFIG